MQEHEKIDYVEFPSRDFAATRAFFERVFGWSFTDYGDEYMAFSNAGLEGGFRRSDQAANTDHGSALVIFYSKDLEGTQQKVEQAGGRILQSIYPFPGGRRFHFQEPSGNEFAVWSDAGP